MNLGRVIPPSVQMQKSPQVPCRCKAGQQLLKVDGRQMNRLEGWLTGDHGCQTQYVHLPNVSAVKFAASRVVIMKTGHQEIQLA